MSNTSNTSISSDIIQASIILSIIDKYVIVILYIFGFIGSLLNIFIFLHKRFRIKSCSIYFLANSIVDFCYINSYILMVVINLFNSKIFSSINSTNLWCKLGNYFYFILPCLASTYLTFASIDRFCASSSNDQLRKFNQLKISYIFAIIIFLIWSLFSLHIPISYDLIRFTPTSSIQCNPQLNLAIVFIIIDGYFFALFIGIFVPICLIILGLLIFRNVKLIHRRILSQPISIINRQENIRLTRGNQHLIKMLLFQVSLTIFLYIPYIVMYLYGIYNSPPENSLALFFYLIFYHIRAWFWIMNYCKTFYINLLSSKTFRNILKRKFIHPVMPIHHENLTHRAIPIAIQNQTYSDSEYSIETRHPVVISN